MVKHWSALPATAQDALIAAFEFAFGAVLYLAGIYPMTSSSGDTSLTVRFTILAGICLLTLLRRRAPLLVLGIGLIPLTIDCLLGPTIPIWILYSDLIYAAVLYSGRMQSRILVATGATLTALAAVITLILTGDWRAGVVVVTLGTAFIGTSTWWALTVRSHKEIADAERARVQALTLVSELDRRAAVADERKTMARDLHDVIAGHLSAIAIQSEAALGVLSRNSSTAPDPAMAGILGSIRSNSVSALQEMRTMIGLLRRDDGAEDDPAAPRRLAQLPILVDAARAAGITVRVQDTQGDIELPSAVDQAAYRIIQEALTNAMKHAPGQEVDIDVQTAATTVAVSVRNALPRDHLTNGATPSDLDTEIRRGLMNMRERAAALGGSFTAGPGSGGWEVHAELPLSATQEMS